MTGRDRRGRSRPAAVSPSATTIVNLPSDGFLDDVRRETKVWGMRPTERGSVDDASTSASIAVVYVA